MAVIPISIHKKAFLGKDFVDFQDAKISVMSHGFMYGTAVFEGIRAYWNPEKQKLYAPTLHGLARPLTSMPLAPPRAG